MDYENPRWYRAIVFDETSLKKLAELFPECGIRTDYDAVRLVEDLTEVLKRMRQRAGEERRKGE